MYLFRICIPNLSEFLKHRLTLLFVVAEGYVGKYGGFVTIISIKLRFAEIKRIFRTPVTWVSFVFGGGITNVLAVRHIRITHPEHIRPFSVRILCTITEWHFHPVDQHMIYTTKGSPQDLDTPCIQ